MLRPWKLEFRINYDCEKAIYLQIADAIIESIKTKKLLSGDALPGSRQLGELLKVNRNTVVEALDVLLAEGWLISKERRGTFVADILPDSKGATEPVIKHVDQIETAPMPGLVFDDGFPDSRLAPMNDIARAYRQIFNRKSRWQLMGYSNEFGDIEFRRSIVQMLNFKRNMNVHINEICITRGSQMAMYLAAHALLKENDLVMIENPGYKPAWQAFENAGAKLLPVNVDNEGLRIDEVEKYLKKRKIRAIYVTPHHQFPTTVTLSLKRRLKLIELSNQYGFTIIEDDYDNEFHFGQRPVLPICSDPRLKNYIYIGTLSKIVAPALRIGYLVSDSQLVKRVGEHRKMIDVQGDNIMEEAILQLIKSGEIKRHLKRTTLLYKEKRDFFYSICDEYLKGKATYHKPDGGLAFWIVPAKNSDLFNVAGKLLKKGIKIMTPDTFSFDRPVSGFRIGYASLTEKQIEEGIAALSQFL